MRAIKAGSQSHQIVVDTVSKNVGLEIAEKYMDPEVDFSLDRKVRSPCPSSAHPRPVQISRSLRAASNDRAEKQFASTSIVQKDRDGPTEDDSQNLFKILMVPFFSSPCRVVLVALLDSVYL